MHIVRTARTAKMTGRAMAHHVSHVGNPRWVGKSEET